MILSSCLKIIRPHQWLKNLLLFFPPFLGGVLLHPQLLSKGMIPFLAFSLASSVTYVFNDLMDRDRDRQHPLKSSRPLASGEMTLSFAVCLMLTLLLATLALANQVSLVFTLLVCLYLLISVLYSLVLKHVPLFDIFCVAMGFVLRLYAGGEVFGVAISEWLFLSVFLLSLFLSLGKRCGEQIKLDEKAGQHRRTLAGYPEGFLESCLSLAGGSVLVTYAIYTISMPPLVYTVPLCTFGLFRYLLRLKLGGSGDPTDALLKDPLLFMTGLLWMAMVGWSIY